MSTAVGDYICHAPTLSLQQVIEVRHKPPSYVARERGQMFARVVKASHCRSLPKVRDRVCVLATNWLHHLMQEDKYRQAIDLSAIESFWFQQVAVLTKVNPVTGIAIITSGSAILYLPYICLALYLGSLSEDAA